jgi:hypothetical protein
MLYTARLPYPAKPGIPGQVCPAQLSLAFPALCSWPVLPGPACPVVPSPPCLDMPCTARPTLQPGPACLALPCPSQLSLALPALCSWPVLHWPVLPGPACRARPAQPALICYVPPSLHSGLAQPLPGLPCTALPLSLNDTETSSEAQCPNYKFQSGLCNRFVLDTMEQAIL